MAIDITTISVELDTTSLKAGTAALDNAAKSGDKLAASATSAGSAAKKGFEDVAQAAKEAEKATNNAATGMGGLSRKAGMAGVQIQQFVGQIQGGQSAFVALSQQGADLGIVLGAPLIGAIVGIGAVIAGTLLPSLFDAGKSAKEVSDLTKELTKDFKDFNEEQKKVLAKGVSVTLTSENEQLKIKSKELREHTKALKDQADAYAKLPSGTTGRGGSGKRAEFESTKQYAAALADVSKSELEILKIQENIKSLKDPAGADKAIKKLKEETDATNLKGAALWELKAKQAGYTDAQAKAYIAQGLLNDAAEKEKKNIAEKESSTKKAIEDQKRLVASSGDYMLAMAKQLELSQQEVDQGEKLTEGQKLQAQQDLLLKEGKLSLTEAQKALTAQEFAQLDINNAANEARKKQLELDKQLLDKTVGKNATLDNEIEKQKEINAKYAAGAQSASDLEQAGFDLAISKLEVEKANDIALGKSPEIIKALEDEIAKTKELQGLKGQEVGLQVIDKAKKKAEEMTKSIGDSLTEALMRGFESGKGFAQNLKDTFQNMFKTLIIKPVIQPIMEKAAGAISSAVSGLSSTGQYALAAAAAVGSLWNDFMEKDFKELTSEYRQGRQSTGTLLGNANAKSDSINKAISELGDNGKSLLDVNHGMYQALLDIRTGISGSAAGFARTGLASGSGGLATGSSSSLNLKADIFGGFVNGVLGSIGSFISSSKTEVIDTGVKIIGTNLANIINTGAVEAFNYAQTKTTKKLFGITTGSSGKEVTQGLDATFEKQFASVFQSAGKALEQASSTFGVKFDAAKLIVNAANLSLKDLKGDELTAEIEHFFSATLDTWAASLAGSLSKFQQVGEGLFETMVRLASQTNIFTNYAEKLLPKFNLVGMAAVEATQSVAKLAGGFDQLNSDMSSYYNNFFTDSEKTKAGLDAISKALADVGVVMPTTREGFRAIVEGLDLSNEAQAKQFAALMNVNQAFAQLVPATKEVSDSAQELKDTYDAIAEQHKTLSEKLFDITATDAQKRQRELDAALSVENRAIQEQIYAALDAKAAIEQQAQAQEEANKAAADTAKEAEQIAKDLADAQIKAAEELAAKLKAIADERYGLESELLRLQGNTTELRARELAKLDESNRALKEQIYALELANEILAKQKEVSSERYGLESELLQLQGNTVELRKRELDKLDLSNRALKEQIYALEDSKVAADAATKAADEAAKAQEQMIQDAQKAAEEQRKLAQGVYDSISGALRALLGESDTLNGMSQARAKMTLQGALVTAKAGGSLVGYAGLEDALKTVQSVDKNTFSSAEAYRLNQAGSIGLLSELAKYTKVSGSHANGLESVPYDGYMAQLHKGERVQTAKEAASNNELVTEIRKLRSEIKAGHLSLVQAGQKTAKILERWDGDGQPETRAVS
jgi:hypothetical protein